MTEQEEQYYTNERNEFVKFINSQEWHAQLRTKAENFIIAFDRLRNKTQPPAGLSDDELIDKLWHKHTDHKEYGDTNHHAFAQEYAQIIAEQRIAEYREVIQEFCDRVDRGEVKSKYTYSKFKQLLSK